MAIAHKAAVSARKGERLSIVDRITPTPGPKEILIKVQALATNIVDVYQRDYGIPPVLIYPAVIGCDVSGLVVKVGSDVPDAPSIGARVIARASSFWQGGSPDHGAFQELVLARWEGVIPLPGHLSFEEGAVFPLAVSTALTSWTTLGTSIDAKYTAQDKQAVLISGGASSVGTFVIQSAKLMGYKIYTTASPKHAEYLKKLGADNVFDYRSEYVVSQIIDTVKKDGVTLTTAVCVVNDSLQPTLDVLRVTKGDGPAKVAHAPVVPENAPTLEGVEVKFVFPPLNEAQRNEHIAKCFHGWLKDGLTAGTVVPSPAIQVVSGGLQALNDALDILKAGVSGTKVVVKM